MARDPIKKMAVPHGEKQINARLSNELWARMRIHKASLGVSGLTIDWSTIIQDALCEYLDANEDKIPTPPQPQETE